MAKSRLQIEYVPLGELKRWPRNPKEHDLGAIHSSIRRFGYVMPILVDESSGQVVAGHGRIDALQQLKDSGENPPERITIRGDDWLVPVIRGVGFAGEVEAEAYALADNRLVELGGWNEEDLAQVLVDLAGADALDGVGWDMDEIDELLAQLEQGPFAPMEDPGAEIGRAEELREEWGTERGQIWEIDRHRLMCGDSTSRADVERLMGHALAALFSTDPPYLIDYSGADRPGGAGKDWSDIYREKEIEDKAGFLKASFSSWLPHLREDAAWFIWHASQTQTLFEEVLTDCGILVHQQIIWVKPIFTFGFAKYRYRHEPCFFGWQKGHLPYYRPNWFKENHTSVWEVDWDGKSRNVGNIHPTEKPVELFAIPMRNHTRHREICAEPFCGSGSQLVAAEQTGRICYAMEIEPGFVAVTLERMAGMGLEPRLVKSHGY